MVPVKLCQLLFHYYLSLFSIYGPRQNSVNYTSIVDGPRRSWSHLLFGGTWSREQLFELSAPSPIQVLLSLIPFVLVAYVHHVRQIHLYI